MYLSLISCAKIMWLRAWSSLCSLHASIACGMAERLFYQNLAAPGALIGYQKESPLDSLA